MVCRDTAGPVARLLRVWSVVGRVQDNLAVVDIDVSCAVTEGRVEKIILKRGKGIGVWNESGTSALFYGVDSPPKPLESTCVKQVGPNTSERAN